jgi:hypothetical protein
MTCDRAVRHQSFSERAGAIVTTLWFNLGGGGLVLQLALSDGLFLNLLPRLHDLRAAIRIDVGGRARAALALRRKFDASGYCARLEVFSLSVNRKLHFPIRFD